MSKLGIGLCLGVVVACSKAEQPAAPTASVGAAAVTASAAASPAPGSAPAPAPAAAPVASASNAPASFKTGSKETIGSAVGLGCEATSLDGWLQLLCRKKNGTGGHPVRAVVHTPGEPAPAANGQEPGAEPADADAPAGTELTPNEQGELSIVVPYAGEEKRDVDIEWTDTRYTLHVTGAKASLEWAATGIPHRRACQQLLDETKAVVAASQKADGEARLTTTEASKLPRFGVCQPGGLGSWALALKAVLGKGEGAARRHHIDVDVVRVAVDGARKSMPFLDLDVAPGGFELAALQVYDYDDDGRDELIVPYEVKATAGATPESYPASVWTFNDAGVAPYRKRPDPHGGIGVEQLDFDMRPDFSSYGPFVAYWGADCGLKVCPPRVTGPKFFLHSVPEGAFADDDDAAKNALKRASCQSKPLAIVAEPGGALNVAQTAKNLVCARAYGVAADVIAAELASKHATLCGEAASCPVQTTFDAWLKLPLPFEITIAAKK